MLKDEDWGLCIDSAIEKDIDRWVDTRKKNKITAHIVNEVPSA